MRTPWHALVVVIIGAVFSLVAGADQRPQLDDVMREKLVRAQKVLEAVVITDWVALEAQSRELERLTEDARWTALKYPEYGTYSGAFRRTIRDLHAAAVRRDLEKAPKAYVAVTLECVNCHRYMARVRMASENSR